MAFCFWSRCSAMLVFPQSIFYPCNVWGRLVTPHSPEEPEASLSRLLEKWQLAGAERQWFNLTKTSTFSCFNKKTMCWVYWFLHIKLFPGLKDEYTYSPEMCFVNSRKCLLLSVILFPFYLSYNRTDWLMEFWKTFGLFTVSPHAKGFQKRWLWVGNL